MINVGKYAIHGSYGHWGIGSQKSREDGVWFPGKPTAAGKIDWHQRDQNTEIASSFAVGSGMMFFFGLKMESKSTFCWWLFEKEAKHLFLWYDSYGHLLPPYLSKGNHAMVGICPSGCPRVCFVHIDMCVQTYTYIHMCTYISFIFIRHHDLHVYIYIYVFAYVRMIPYAHSDSS